MRRSTFPLKKTKFSTLFVCFLGMYTFAQTTSLVVIDENYPNKQSLLASVPKSVRILQFDQYNNLWAEIRSAMAEDIEIWNIHFFINTTDSELEIGNAKIGAEELEKTTNLQNLATLVDSNRKPNLFVYSCSLAKNAKGVSLLETIGQKTNFNVMSSSSCSSVFEPNFNFDYSSKNQLTDTNLILD